MNPLSLDTFTEKLGPLPVWAWAGIGGLALAGIAFATRGNPKTGEVILQPGANAQGNEGEFGYGAGFDPGSVGTGQGGDSVGSGSPPAGEGAPTFASESFAFTSSEPVSTTQASGGSSEPTSEPNYPVYAPVYETVTAGGWTGQVTAAGIPVSAGVDMTDLDASLASIGIVPPAGGWPEPATAVAVVAANEPAQPYPIALDPGYNAANIYASDNAAASAAIAAGDNFF